MNKLLKKKEVEAIHLWALATTRDEAQESIKDRMNDLDKQEQVYETNNQHKLEYNRVI